MPNSTNTNPLPWRHMHDKEDIIGLSKDLMFIDIYISADGDFYWKQKDPYTHPLQIDKTIPEGYGASMMGESDVGTFMDTIKEYEYILVNKILDERQSWDSYRGYRTGGVAFIFNESIRRQKNPINKPGSIDLFKIIRTKGINSDIIVPVTWDQHSIINEFKSQNWYIYFHVATEQNTPSEREENTLYFITET